MDIPVFACTIADQRNITQYPQQATGYGCHPIATIALARAITEAAQSRLTHVSGLREDLTWSRYREEFLCEADKSRLSLAKMSNQPPTVDLSNICLDSERVAVSMEVLQQQVLKCLGKANLKSAVVINLAANEIFSVVYVCVPGLEYRTQKASIQYVPGSRMRKYLEQKGYTLNDCLEV